MSTYNIIIFLWRNKKNHPRIITKYSFARAFLIPLQESQDSATWKESSADHEVADDCLVIEMEQEKPEV